MVNFELMKRLILPFLLTAASAAAAGPAIPAAPAPELPVALKERPVRLPPLFWYERDTEAQSRLLMVSMLYWDVRDGDTSHRLLLPIFYRWREGNRSFFMSLPLVLAYSRPGDRWLLAGPFYRASDDEKTQTMLFPLYWQRVRRQGGRVTVAAPFVFYDYRSHDRSVIDTAFPVGFFRRRGNMTMGLIGPYFWETDPDSRFRVLFPILWRARSPELRYDVLPPFYDVWKADPVFLSSAPASGRRYMGVFPVVGAGRGSDYFSNYFFPFYFYSRDGDRRGLLTIPFSSFHREDMRSGHVGLYYYSHDPDLRMDGVFPFWMRRASADGFESKTQVLNFYYSRENEDVFHTLFPLYGAWSNPEESRFLSWGYWRRSNSEGTAGWAGLYFWKHDRTGDENRVFFPLYWHYSRPPDWRVDVIFPLFMRFRDADSVVTVVPPFIVRTAPGRRTVSFFFLYWHDSEGDRSLTTLAPFFLSQRNPDRKSFFSPLLWTRRSHLSHEGIFPPVYWYRSAEAKRTIVFPIYWDIRTAKFDLWILPPAYRLRMDNVTEIGVFPLWGRRTARVEEKGVVRRESRGGYLLPFYWSDVDGKGNGTWIIPPILGFIGRSGVGTPEETFSMNYLLLGSVRRSSGTLEHGFFPLYQYVRKKDELNWWAPRILALAAYDRKGQERKGVVIPYLWWRSPAADRDLALPLFYRSRLYEVVPSTGGVFRRGDRIGGTTIFFPVWWSGTGRDHTYLYLPPLYAFDRDGARTWRVVVPLWASYDGEAGRTFRVLFPIYWRYASARRPPEESPVEKRDISVWGPFYRVDTLSKGRHTRTVGVAPIFSRTYTDPDDKYFEILGGLFGRDVQAGRRRFRFLWFLYTPAKPLR
jgi:hypothetical protein